MADSPDGKVSMNYAVLNDKQEWEVLRLYTFKKFEDGIYYRDAELETNPEIKFRLADIPLPNGILRVDKVSFPLTTELRYGHYSLPELESHIVTKEQKAGGYTAYCMVMVPIKQRLSISRVGRKWNLYRLKDYIR